jgi:CheY-like chemotaxis protein
VDDDPAICELLVTLLELTGFVALTACDGLDALRQLRVAGPRPAVILLDLMMPTSRITAKRSASAGIQRLSREVFLAV